MKLLSYLLIAAMTAVAGVGNASEAGIAPMVIEGTAAIEVGGGTTPTLERLEVAVFAAGNPIPATLFLDEPDADGVCRFEVACPFQWPGQYRVSQ